MNDDRILLSALVDHSTSPRILDIHLDECEDDACTGCEPQHLAEKAAARSTARQEIAARLWMCVPSADDYEAKARPEQMLDAYRAEVLAEAADEIAAAVERCRADCPDEAAMVTRRLGMRAAERITRSLIAEAGESRG
ncbi:hypothetical protein [Streptomyces sp. WM6349]|uniref:hypothetical protein n=1 Tax=Streptomyces sp. WM6349 TaxID=1415552 RepID=UPI0006AE076C|nr:hypothetical protein [Streptomyces sp. WM6349]KOU17063.1 hypothetical protein ADK49_17170 [Streptomyces sp. WM6349]